MIRQIITERKNLRISFKEEYEGDEYGIFQVFYDGCEMFMNSEGGIDETGDYIRTSILTDEEWEEYGLECWLEWKIEMLKHSIELLRA